MSIHDVKIKHVGNNVYEIFVNRDYAGSVEVKPNVITAYYTDTKGGEARITHTMTDDFDVATSIVIGSYIKNNRQQ